MSLRPSASKADTLPDCAMSRCIFAPECGPGHPSTAQRLPRISPSRKGENPTRPWKSLVFCSSAVWYPDHRHTPTGPRVNGLQCQRARLAGSLGGSAVALRLKGGDGSQSRIWASEKTLCAEAGRGPVRRGSLRFSEGIGCQAISSTQLPVAG